MTHDDEPPRTEGPHAGRDARALPHDLAAEQSVLGAILLSRGAVLHELAATLDPGDFYVPRHETVLRAMLAMYAAGDPIDAVTVAGELREAGDLNRVGGATALHDLLESVPTTANAGYYARIVHERAVLRRLVQAGTKITQLGYATDGGEVAAMVAAAQAEVADLDPSSGGAGLVRAADALTATTDMLEEYAKATGEIRGVPTGFADLDRLTSGLHPGQLIIIAGRPASGKSALALDLARSAALGHKVPTAVFGLEMPNSETMLRLISAQGRIPLQNLRTGRMTDRDWDRYSQVWPSIEEAPLWLDDDPAVTPAAIMARCMRLRAQHGLGLVVVDYLQLMSSGRRVESRQQEVSQFSRALKLAAKKLEVPVVALSQLNRGPEMRNDKRPMLADLRESGSIEQDADVVILVYREDMYDKETPRAGEADLIVAKHRNGPTDTVTVAFQGHHSRFVDMASDMGRPANQHIPSTVFGLYPQD